MASPQKENGFTPIANEIMEALAKHRISGELRQIIDFIIRKTWGYGKKDDQVSNSQFCQGTGMNKGNVCRAIRGCQKRLLVVINNNTSPPTYCFNKDYSQWVPVVKSDNKIKKVVNIATSVVNIATSVVNNDNKTLSILTNTKEKKDNIQKKLYKRKVPIAKAIGPEEKNDESKQIRRDTWEAYKKSYSEKYFTEPVRNQKQNSLIKKFVERIGKESPGVIAFYLTHRMALYCRAMHPLDLAVRDAERLRTEWLTGRQQTEQAARQQDRTQSTIGAVEEILRERGEKT